jgi:uncharacterized membrane protein (DUF373 family)
VAALLSAAAAGGVIQAGLLLWQSASGATPSTYGLGVLVLDQFLLVLMIVELLHTARISIQSQALTMEPFLVVGLIASIRRVLVDAGS